MVAVKNALKKVLPPPVSSFMREVNRIVAIEERNQQALDKLIETVERQEKQLNIQREALQYQEQRMQALLNTVEVQESMQVALNDLLDQQKDMMITLNKEQQLAISKLQNDVLQSKQEHLATMIEADEEQRSAIVNMQSEIVKGQQEQVALIKAISEAQGKYAESSVMQAESQMKVIEQLKQQQEVIKADAKAARNHAWKSQKNSDEILWAEIFHDASSNSTWLQDKAFSAARSCTSSNIPHFYTYKK